MSAGTRRLTLVPQAQPTLAERAAVARADMDAILAEAAGELLMALERVECAAAFLREIETAPDSVRELAGRLAAHAGHERSSVLLNRIVGR